MLSARSFIRCQSSNKGTQINSVPVVVTTQLSNSGVLFQSRHASLDASTPRATVSNTEHVSRQIIESACANIALLCSARPPQCSANFTAICLLYGTILVFLNPASPTSVT